MSKAICFIPNTGKRGAPLYMTQFCGPVEKGIMLQLTQWVGEGGINCPGYIELTEADATRLQAQLALWLLTVRCGEVLKSDSLSTS